MTLEETKQAIPQGAFDLYDAYAHSDMTRRDFLAQLSRYAVGGLTLSMLSAALLPDYANAQQIEAGDPRLDETELAYSSPRGAGDMMGYLVKPEGLGAKTTGAIVVIHENRGLNPHIRDVARRAALAGYVAFAPDALYPLGGYPGTDDEGRVLQRKRDRSEMLEDFIAAAEVLRAHPNSNGKVGCVGFCFGGSVANLMAVRLPWLAAAVPFYGGWPTAEDAKAVNAPLQIHLAGLDKRVNVGWPKYEAALKAANTSYQAHIYPDVNHGFHNDTTGRFDSEAAKLAWTRTLAFFGTHLSA